MRHRRHSRAGGGLNMCHNGLEHTSQVVGMWKLIATSSWPLWLTVPGFSSRPTKSGGGVLSSGLRDSPEKNQIVVRQSAVKTKETRFRRRRYSRQYLRQRREFEEFVESLWHRHVWHLLAWQAGRGRLCSSRGWEWGRRSVYHFPSCKRRFSWMKQPRTAFANHDVECFAWME